MNEDKIIEQLQSISGAFDLKIEDRDAISMAIEAVREKNKTIHIVTLLEALTKEGFCKQIFEYAIWKLVCGYIDSYPIMKQRKQACIDECKRAIGKWVVE